MWEEGQPSALAGHSETFDDQAAIRGRRISLEPFSHRLVFVGLVGFLIVSFSFFGKNAIAHESFALSKAQPESF